MLGDHIVHSNSFNDEILRYVVVIYFSGLFCFSFLLLLFNFVFGVTVTLFEFSFGGQLFCLHLCTPCRK